MTLIANAHPLETSPRRRPETLGDTVGRTMHTLQALSVALPAGAVARIVEMAHTQHISLVEAFHCLSPALKLAGVTTGGLDALFLALGGIGAGYVLRQSDWEGVRDFWSSYRPVVAWGATLSGVVGLMGLAAGAVY